MKSKIFKPVWFALALLLAISTTTFAQLKPGPPVPPAAPPAAPKPVIVPMPRIDVTTKLSPLNQKDLQIKMKDLQVKMKDLQVKMRVINKMQLKNMHIKLKNFNYKFDTLKNFNFKFDSLGDFVYKFDSSITPNVAFGFRDFDNNFNFNDADANSSRKQDGIEKTKNYSKSYSIDNNDVINIDNRFGKVTVTTWAKNEVKVDVQIKVAANNDDKAQKLLDNVSIRDSKDGSGVFFKTIIGSDDNNNSWGGLFGGKRNSVHSITINYTVYMPVKSALNVINKYGSTDLPDLTGKLNIENTYGSLVAKALSNSGNQITVKYGSANIGALNGSDLEVAYGSLTLGDCNKLNANISYSSAKIGKLTTSGNFNLKFGGGLNIDEVDKNIKNLSVKSSYTSIKLGISDEQNADFDVTVHYGSFNYGGHDVAITSKSPDDSQRGFNPTKNYKGRLGKGGSEKIITINSDYGSVKFD